MHQLLPLADFRISFAETFLTTRRLFRTFAEAFILHHVVGHFSTWRMLATVVITWLLCEDINPTFSCSHLIPRRDYNLKLLLWKFDGNRSNTGATQTILPLLKQATTAWIACHGAFVIQEPFRMRCISSFVVHQHVCDDFEALFGLLFVMSASCITCYGNK